MKDANEIPKEDLAVKINRIEVINHAQNRFPMGRLLTLYKMTGDFEGIELSYQDNGETLKIFID
jgi:hypothetical protein